MADISKIKINEGEALNIKDALGRSNMTTLLGGHTLTGLGDAAWLNVVDSVADSNMNPVTSNAVYDAIQALGQALHFVGIATKQEGETEIEAVLFQENSLELNRLRITLFSDFINQRTSRISKSQHASNLVVGFSCRIISCSSENLVFTVIFHNNKM